MNKKVTHDSVYINVMELLVSEEVDQQLRKLPERVSKYVKRSEVATFALNRLPALYASSEKGLQYQRDRARRELKAQITGVVRQALAAVQIDPIRLSKPIQIENYASESEAVLQVLSEWFRLPNLTWEKALAKVQRLNQRSQPRDAIAYTSAPNTLPMPPAKATPASGVTPAYRSAQRPGTYSQAHWQSRQSPESEVVGFEDAYLR